MFGTGTHHIRSYSPRTQEILPAKEAGEERRSPEAPASTVHKATASIYNPHKCEVSKEQSGRDPSLHKVLFRFSRGIIVTSDINLVTFVSTGLLL